MSRFFISILFFLFLSESLLAQSVPDSASPVYDTMTNARDSVSFSQSSTSSFADSVSKRPEGTKNWSSPIGDDFFKRDFNQEIVERHPYFGITAPSQIVISDQKKFIGKEFLFYTLIILLVSFALLKIAFQKYVDDLFRFFFHTTLKQRQIREQLMQSPLPSILFNVFFVVVASLYVALLLTYFKYSENEDFWTMFLYSCIGISGIYLVKFLGLKISGWIFNSEEIANIYIFIVFIVNKIISLFLLPFIVLLSFTKGSVNEISWVLSWCGIGALYVYRLILSYSAVRNQVKLNPFLFFIYLCAFEIAPLLVLYKVLL
ncbi:MAG: DUF4271 domain-containing protein, partial [Bacteroidetes bacterium]|nr:DUF4271 domain-containing protein [Bacteroidota bacterium]